MLRSILLLAVVAIVVATAAKPKWHQLEGYTFERYEEDFRKSYDTPAERESRKQIFEANLAVVRAHNAGPSSYKKGVNYMSDFNALELTARNGRRPDSQMPPTAPTRVLKSTGVAVPESLDWRTAFPVVVSAVKNQGQCGSCWAHAATETVESQWALATGELYVLSQQQLTACVNNTVLQCGGTGGCAGATAELAFDYLTARKGMTQEWEYGYTAFNGSSGVCNITVNMTLPVQINGYTMIERNNADAVMEAVAVNGPIAISVDASEWYMYESGVYDGCDYRKNITMDHAVVLIGYGHDAALGKDYWLVRNSWSAGYGEAGYIRLLRQPGNESCGWNNDWTTDGGGCKGEANNVWACGQCGILYDVVFPNANATRPPAPSSPSSSKAWIAGPVIGGIVVLAVAVIVIVKMKGASSAESNVLLDQN